MRARSSSVGDFQGLVSDRNRRRDRMAVPRTKPLFLGLFLAVALGTVVYFRLWAIDYKFSSDEAELLRRQFDLANKEAMDESAEWRLRFDEEREKAAKCANELKEFKESLQDKAENTGHTKRLEMLQRENIDLLERLETMKQELESEKLKCSRV